MLYTQRTLIASLVVILVLTACQPDSRKALRLEGADSGTTVELEVGQELAVELEGNLSTGYSWEALPDESGVLKQFGEPEFKAESDLVGAGGLMTLHFRAISPGETVLHLVYHRPWEQDVEPLEDFEATVIVK